MKTIVLALSILLSVNCSAQQNITNNTVIPVAVTDAFLKKFPNSTEVKWDHPTTPTATPSTSVYIVSFKTSMSDRLNQAWLDKDGTVLKHAKDVEIKELPVAVQEAIGGQYAAHRLAHLRRIEQKGTTSYIFEANKDGKTRLVTVGENGETLGTADAGR
jgi:hypothetical protein